VVSSKAYYGNNKTNPGDLAEATVQKLQALDAAASTPATGGTGGVAPGGESEVEVLN
jgi:hypothetical protein